MKIFPVHWSFLIGEVTIFSFVVLVATGLFLTMFYVPSAETAVYEGSSTLHQGRALPAAYESVIRLTHDVDAGLLVRRTHRAASHLLIASAIAHFVRVLLMGSFRSPREPNYHLGLVLLLLVVAAGWVGHNLPMDVLSGTSLRILYSMLLSLPWVGDPVAYWIFGGEFPTATMVSRFFAIHVLWLPIAITALISLHMLLVVRQQHTQVPEEGVDGSRTIVGEPLWPWQAVSSIVLFLGVVGLLTAAALLVPWSDIDYLGPYRVGDVVQQSQPDWFLFWVEGLLRLVPAFQFSLLGAVWSQVFVAGVALPLLVVVLLFAYPAIETRITGWRGVSHVTDHPLDVPMRLGLVVGVLVFLAIASVAAAQDVVARVLAGPVEVVARTLGVAILVAPPLAGLAAGAYARRQSRRWRGPRGS